MFCASCNTPLHLSNIESERRYGLGSILFIRCQNNVCWALNDVKTGKRSQGAFDVNSKLALGNYFTFKNGLLFITNNGYCQKVWRGSKYFSGAMGLSSVYHSANKKKLKTNKQI